MIGEGDCHVIPAPRLDAAWRGTHGLTAEHLEHQAATAVYAERAGVVVVHWSDGGDAAAAVRGGATAHDDLHAAMNRRL